MKYKLNIYLISGIEGTMKRDEGREGREDRKTGGGCMYTIDRSGSTGQFGLKKETGTGPL
jgi:hypothetical protein